MFSYGVSKKVRWICSKCGYKYPAFISSRIQGHGCPACAGKVVIKGKNDLATVCPDSLSIWDYEKNNGTPSDYCAYTTKKHIGNVINAGMSGIHRSAVLQVEPAVGNAPRKNGLSRIETICFRKKVPSLMSTRNFWRNGIIRTIRSRLSSFFRYSR